MSIRIILSVALLAAIQNANAESFIKYNNHDTVAANTPPDIIYEQPSQAGAMTDTSRPSLPAITPTYNATKLVLKRNTRYKLGRAVIKYELLNKNHSMEKAYLRKRTASIM